MAAIAPAVSGRRGVGAGARGDTLGSEAIARGRKRPPVAIFQGRRFAIAVRCETPMRNLRNLETSPLLDEQAKKTLLRKIPHGIYICGVRDASGDEMNGFTASWVMQGSFKPPLVVNCVNRESGSHAMLQATGVFTLSFLEAGQKDLAAKFFKPQRRVGNKFEDVEFYLGDATGCPIIRDTLGYVECKVIGSVPQGDHTVFVGEVIGAGVHREGEPLLLETTGWNYGG